MSGHDKQFPDRSAHASDQGHSFAEGARGPATVPSGDGANNKGWRLSRRQVSRWLAIAPLAAACGETVASVDAGGDAGPITPRDASTPDAFVPDAAADGGVCELTQRDALGPFFEGGSPVRRAIAGLDEPGDPLLFEGQLVDVRDCVRPLAGYVVDLWQADALGNYHPAGSTDFRLRGRITTGADGRFAFETIKPGFYETGAGPRPAHLHLRVYGPDGVDRLVTQVYFEGDEFLGAADSCQPPTCFSGDPERVMRLDPARVGERDGVRGDLRLTVRA